MKTTIVSKEVNEEIDWSKPQWLKTEFGLICFTNGQHDGSDFEGTALPCDDNPNGDFSRMWDKRQFKPIPKDGLTIHIQND